MRKPLKRPTMSEAEVKIAVKDWLEWAGFLYHQNNEGPKMMRGIRLKSDTPGRPDLEVYLPDGRRCLIELKEESWIPPNKPQGMRVCKKYEHYLRQKRWIDECNEYNGLAFFCRSVEELELNLSEYLLPNGRAMKPKDMLPN